MSSLSHPLPPAQHSQLIELIFAGHALAARLTTFNSENTHCLCGKFIGQVTNPDNHLNAICPVGRYYRAVEELDSVVRS